jgi:hypothetical protein
MIFRTGGDWDSTTLWFNGEELLANQLYVELHAGHDEYGEPADGGVGLGGDLTAFVRTQADPDRELGVFPGRLEMLFPQHNVTIENTHPGFAFEFTRVWYNGHDVTDDVIELIVNVDAPNNEVRAYITVYRSHWIAADEIATYNIV